MHAIFSRIGNGKREFKESVFQLNLENRLHLEFPELVQVAQPEVKHKSARSAPTDLV